LIRMPERVTRLIEVIAGSPKSFDDAVIAASQGRAKS